MTAPDVFALGGRQGDDAEILALFREWRAVCRVLDSRRDAPDDDPEWNGACDRQWAIEERIFELGGGAAGVAVKLFLHFYREACNWAPSSDQLKLNGDEDGRTGVGN